MHVSFVKAAVYASDSNGKWPHSILASYALDRPRERPERQRVWQTDSISLLDVVHDKTAHVVHGYGVRGKFDKVIPQLLQQLWVQFLAAFVYVHRVCKAGVADLTAAEFHIRFGEHDGCQKLDV